MTTIRDHTLFKLIMLVLVGGSRYVLIMTTNTGRSAAVGERSWIAVGDRRGGHLETPRFFGAGRARGSRGQYQNLR